MLVAVDIDGCADAYPREFGTMMQALRAAGHRIIIVTGTSEETATDQDLDEKQEYLANLGLGQCYDDIFVCAHPGDTDVADVKSKLLEDLGVHVLFDNRKKNAKAAPCLALVPWQTRQ